MSLDGAVAMDDGASKWITGAEARAHAHVERARHEAILIGRGTLDADAPTLDVRLAGLEATEPAAFPPVAERRARGVGSPASSSRHP